MRYYETYYELYGRTINLVTFEGTGNATDEVAARADAAADRRAVPAVRRARRPGADQRVRRRAGRAPRSCASAARRASRRSSTPIAIPYVWGLDGSPLQKQAHVVEFLTKQLIGKNAEHGGDAREGPAAQVRPALPREQRCGEGARRQHSPPAMEAARLAVRRGRRLPARSGHDPDRPRRR